MYSEFFQWNNSDILLDFYWITANLSWKFSKGIFSYGNFFKLLRKDSDPSYLRVGYGKME
jgi:hypothetical protein